VEEKSRLTKKNNVRMGTIPKPTLNPDDHPRHWSKMIEQLYWKSFRGKGFRVTNETFSQTELLDCVGTETHACLEVVRTVKDLCHTMPETILVVGPGSGSLSSMLRRSFKKSMIYEVDINAVVIDRLISLHAQDDKRRAIQADVHHLPFSDHTIDVVVGYGVFRYISDERGAISEIQRVLRKDSLALFAEGRSRRYVEKIEQKLNQMQISCRVGSIANVPMPHMTFFYFLLEQYGKNALVSTLVAEAMKKKKVSRIKATYALAGQSRGTIYTISWRGSHD